MGVARATFLAGCVSVVACVAGCQTPKYEMNWNRMRVGMTQDEVAGALGEPSSSYLPPPAAVVKPGTSAGRGPGPMRGERWQYGDTLSSFATRAVYPDEADERAWCVFFGPDGKVSGFRPPSWADAKRSQDPQEHAAQPAVELAAQPAAELAAKPAAGHSQAASEPPQSAPELPNP